VEAENRFVVSRLDGRSNQQVVIDHVKDAEPGAVFTYDDLAVELGKDVDRTFDRDAVRQTVANANERLLREYKRCLDNVRGVGYVVAHARDHERLADDRNRRARRQMRKGLARLQNVRMDEMTAAERERHTAQMVINSAVFQAVDSLQRKQDHTNRLLARLTGRVDQVEAKQQTTPA